MGCHSTTYQYIVEDTFRGFFVINHEVENPGLLYPPLDKKWSEVPVWSKATAAKENGCEKPEI